MFNSLPSKGATLLTGNSHRELAQLISQHLDIPLGKCDVIKKSNSETGVEIKETVRGRDVYIIQTGQNSSELPCSEVHNGTDPIPFGVASCCKLFSFLLTGTKNVNNDIMELMIMIYACKTSSARSITVLMPYLPYCKQSKMRKRGSIVSKLLATMLSRSGMTRLITMDLYSKEIQVRQFSSLERRNSAVVSLPVREEREISV